uniref:Uncharacterized protein n=1 Tax=Cacopsylla melanoneura TaxID=428564 RepID=A0A8D8RPB8_9HEMI
MENDTGINPTPCLETRYTINCEDKKKPGMTYLTNIIQALKRGLEISVTARNVCFILHGVEGCVNNTDRLNSTKFAPPPIALSLKQTLPYPLNIHHLQTKTY